MGRPAGTALVAVWIAVVATGCPAPRSTGLARQALEETVVDTDYGTAFEAARTVLLNDGSALDHADYASGTLVCSRRVRIKDPRLAAALGVLPGGGSFYTRAYGLGVLDAFLWLLFPPLGIAIDAPTAAARASHLTETEQVNVVLRTVRDGVAVRYSRRPERSPAEDAREEQRFLAALRSQLTLAGAGPAAHRGGLEVRVPPGPENVAAPSPILGPGSRYAVVIGISRYEASKLTLKHARHDAEAVYAFLTSPAGGVSPENARLLVDREATLRNVKSALGEFLARSAKPQDTVIIYFAGHGAPEPDLSGLADDGVEKYLVPVDADPVSLFTTALPVAELERIFRRIEAGRVIMLLDSCFSGSASPGGRTFSRDLAGRRVAVTSEFLRRVARGSGRILITASAANEVALESDRVGHGLFTQYLLAGLEGAAARADGSITVLSLYQYLDAQLPGAARANGASQHPALIGRVDEDIVLVEAAGTR